MKRALLIILSATLCSLGLPTGASAQQTAPQVVTPPDMMLGHALPDGFGQKPDTSTKQVGDDTETTESYRGMDPPSSLEIVITTTRDKNGQVKRRRMVLRRISLEGFKEERVVDDDGFNELGGFNRTDDDDRYLKDVRYEHTHYSEKCTSDGRKINIVSGDESVVEYDMLTGSEKSRKERKFNPQTNEFEIASAAAPQGPRFWAVAAPTLAAIGIALVLISDHPKSSETTGDRTTGARAIGHALGLRIRLQLPMR
jgi:hypothetical protein